MMEDMKYLMIIQVKNNYFELSKSVDSMIDEYIINCQLGDEVIV